MRLAAAALGPCAVLVVWIGWTQPPPPRIVIEPLFAGVLSVPIGFALRPFYTLVELEIGNGLDSSVGLEPLLFATAFLVGLGLADAVRRKVAARASLK